MTRYGAIEVMHKPPARRSLVHQQPAQLLLIRRCARLHDISKHSAPVSGAHRHAEISQRLVTPRNEVRIVLERLFRVFLIVLM